MKARFKIGMFVEVKGEGKSSLEKIDALVCYADHIEYVTDKSEEPVKEDDIITGYKALADRKPRTPKAEKTTAKMKSKK